MFPSRRRPKTIRSIPPQQARAKTNPNGPPASKRRIWANQCIAGFIRACDRPPLLKNRKCATSAQTRWACPQGTLLKEQSQPRDNDLNPGFWMTSYSSRTKNMTCFAAAATASYSPLVNKLQNAVCGRQPFGLTAAFHFSAGREKLDVTLQVAVQIRPRVQRG